MLQPLAALAALPREVSRIEIEHTSELMARRVSEAVARPGVEVVDELAIAWRSLPDTR